MLPLFDENLPGRGIPWVTIGLIGVGLDWLVRRLERLDEVRWGFSKP